MRALTSGGDGGMFVGWSGGRGRGGGDGKVAHSGHGADNKRAGRGTEGGNTNFLIFTALIEL